MKKFLIVFFILSFSTNSLSDSRSYGAAVTTTTLLGSTTTTLSTDNGVLPVATALLQKQKSASNSLGPYIAGGACIGLAAMLGYCTPTVAPYCIPPAAICTGVALLLKSNIDSAADQTDRSIAAVTTNTSSTTIYNRPTGTVPPDVVVNTENPNRGKPAA